MEQRFTVQIVAESARSGLSIRKYLTDDNLSNRIINTLCDTQAIY
jgi:hypothetical protein